MKQPFLVRQVWEPLAHGSPQRRCCLFKGFRPGLNAQIIHNPAQSGCIDLGSDVVQQHAGNPVFSHRRRGAADTLPFSLLTGEAQPVIMRRTVSQCIARAGIAQLVEYKLPKLGVAGSNPVSRSSFFLEW